MTLEKKLKINKLQSSSQVLYNNVHAYIIIIIIERTAFDEFSGK